LGYFLIWEQNPQEVDVIVVLKGRDVERSLAAVDVYKKGYANLIVMAKAAEDPGSAEFRKRVGNKFEGKGFFQRAIEAMDVPEKSIQFIGNGVASTHDEALVVKEFLRENGYKSILLVTSKWHSKRAYLTFKSVFKNDDGITIIVNPSSYDNFNPEGWWKNKNDTKLIFDEYLKFIYYTLTFQISFLDLFNQ
jgi:uncharacterized SAM-binding protein YcdF (DUF218 family)